MATSPLQTIKKLQEACNTRFDAHITYNRSQFYSESQHRPISMYIVKKAVYDDQKGKFTYEELFSSASQIQIIKFLRDYWYELNGWEVPTNDELWNAAKAKYAAKKQNWHDAQFAVEA